MQGRCEGRGVRRGKRAFVARAQRTILAEAEVSTLTSGGPWVHPTRGLERWCDGFRRWSPRTRQSRGISGRHTGARGADGMLLMPGGREAP
jgi:hypothetical protein